MERHECARRTVEAEIESGVVRSEPNGLLADVDGAEAVEEQGKGGHDVGPCVAVDGHLRIHVGMLRRTCHGAPVR